VALDRVGVLAVHDPVARDVAALAGVADPIGRVGRDAAAVELIGIGNLRAVVGETGQAIAVEVGERDRLGFSVRRAQSSATGSLVGVEGPRSTSPRGCRRHQCRTRAAR